MDLKKNFFFFLEIEVVGFGEGGEDRVEEERGRRRGGVVGRGQWRV